MKALFKRLDTIIALLLADREERKAEREARLSAENERRLVEYAKANQKHLPAGNFVNGRDAQSPPVHKSDGDLIPFGISERDRQILDDFYSR
jgi:hypothetical protein